MAAMLARSPRWLLEAPSPILVFLSLFFLSMPSFLYVFNNTPSSFFCLSHLLVAVPVSSTAPRSVIILSLAVITARPVSGPPCGSALHSFFSAGPAALLVLSWVGEQAFLAPPLSNSGTLTLTSNDVFLSFSS